MTSAAQPVEPAKVVESAAVPAEAVESAAERARRLWDGDVLSTSRALLAELGSDEFSEVLLPWVADRVRAVMRNEVRHAESLAFTRSAGRHVTSVRDQRGPLPTLDNLEYLLGLPVLVPGATRTRTVLWRNMTADDHQNRIRLLRRPLKGIQETVSRHEWSIMEITRYSVNCLNDIDIQVLRADLPK